MTDITMFVLVILNLVLLGILCAWINSINRRSEHTEDTVKKLTKNLDEVESDNARLYLMISALEKDGDSNE